jgi:hypothetical protein
MQLKDSSYRKLQHQLIRAKALTLSIGWEKAETFIFAPTPDYAELIPHLDSARWDSDFDIYDVIRQFCRGHGSN